MVLFDWMINEYWMNGECKMSVLWMYDECILVWVLRMVLVWMEWNEECKWMYCVYGEGKEKLESWMF